MFELGERADIVLHLLLYYTCILDFPLHPIKCSCLHNIVHMCLVASLDALAKFMSISKL